MVKKYTVGFLFTPDLKKVLLIHKLAPEWQKGKINGLGGKMEKGEEGVSSFIREIFEESGIALNKKVVRYIGMLKGFDWQVLVYGVIYSGEVFDSKIHEKEKIEWFDVDELPKQCLPNLRWMIPFICNEFEANTGNSFLVSEDKFDTSLI